MAEYLVEGGWGATPLAWAELYRGPARACSHTVWRSGAEGEAAAPPAECEPPPPLLSLPVSLLYTPAWRVCRR